MDNPLNQNKMELLRPREAAAMFGVRQATIARWAREGKISAILTPGGHRRYNSIEVTELIDRRG
jgi:excisionase family DNA binding protein